MRNLFLLAAALLLNTAAMMANTVVFVDDTGVYIEQTELSCEEIYANAAASSYDGEVSCWNFDMTQGGSTVVNGTAVPAVSIKEVINSDASGDQDCMTPYMVYQTPKGVQMVRVSEKSDMKGLLKNFSQREACGESPEAQLLWASPAGKGGNVSVNGKRLNVPTGVFTVSLYGEILISGEPIEFEE